MAILVAVVMAGCGGEKQEAAARPPSVQKDPIERSREFPEDRPAFVRAPMGIVIVDQDAGAVLPDGSRAGALLVAYETDFEVHHLNAFIDATDDRWVEPTDALQLPDGSWLVLESKWAIDGGEERGAIFHVPLAPPPGDPKETTWRRLGRPELWWNDVRTRQPVCFVRDSEGTIFVSDRDADPDGVLPANPGRQRTGCVFGIEVGADGRPARTAVVAAGPEFFTPGALLASGPLLLLMDADANPRGLKAPDGRLATPGVLFDLVLPAGSDRLARRRADVLVQAEGTTSPIALIERRRWNGHHWAGMSDDSVPPAAWAGLQPGEPLPDWLPEVYLVDANFGTTQDILGDGAFFWVRFRSNQSGASMAHGLAADLVLRGETIRTLSRHSLVDPAYGCSLPSGDLLIADANLDPLKLGPDGTGKGVYGTGRGAILCWNPNHPEQLDVRIASELFVTPVAVRMLEH